MPGGPSTAYKGRNMLLKIDPTGGSPQVYYTVAGLRAKNLEINGGAVDITNQASAGWQEMLAGGGVKSVNISADGVVSRDATNDADAFKAIQMLFADDFVNAQIVSDSGDILEGQFAIASISRGGPHDNAETFSVSLNSNGPISYTAPA